MMSDARVRSSAARTGFTTLVMCVVAFLAGSLWEKAASGALQRRDTAATVAAALASQRAELLQQQAKTTAEAATETMSHTKLQQQVAAVPAPAQAVPRAALTASLEAGDSRHRQQLVSIIDVCDFPRPSPAVGHYDAAYFGWQVKENMNNVGWQRARLKPSLEAAPRAAVFEVGCSGGYTLASIAAGSKHCYEVNDVAVAHAQQKHPDIHMYKRWADVPDDAIDYAYSFDSFEHHVSPLDNLLCLYSKMRRGGTVHIEVPFEHGSFGGSSPNVYGRRWRPNDPNNHLFTWSPLVLGNFVQAAGFRVSACRDGEEMWNTWRAERRQAAPGPREKLAVWCLGVKD